MKKIFLIIFSLLWMTEKAFSQCAMCRASLESSSDVSHAEGINNGIMYLMAFPYILVGIIGFLVYRYMKKNKVSN